MNKIVCPYCFAPNAYGGRCDRCGELIPQQLNGSEMMFSIIGSTESGKSHYIATLIAQLYSQAHRFHWSCCALNDETMNLYDERFRKTLYEDKDVIVKTQTRNIREHRPLIYSLSFDSGVPPVTLVFYDAAGERFNNEAELATTTRYLNESSGIIFLIDPLQLEAVREAYVLLGHGKESDLPTLPESAGRVSNIFQRLVTVLRTKERRTGRVQTPVALTLSKIDALRFLFTDEAPLFLPSFHRRYGCFCHSDAARIDEYIRSFLTVYDQRRELLNLMRNLDQCACFGVSALGQNPKSNGQKLRFPPRPLRVLDPFLWLLAQHDRISTIE